MCGIIGYLGEDEAAPVLTDGLERLEYRGYDSAGIAVFESGGIHTIKSNGRLSSLREKIKDQGTPRGTLGIGHTRWATHGKPSDYNAHPHSGEKGKITLVHNGIIENYIELKAQLQAEGVKFTSDTDTEVVAQLAEKNYNGNLIETIVKTVSQLKGSFALGILCEDYPDTLVGVRKSSPLLAAVCDKGCLIASDITALLPYSEEIYRMEDGEICVFTKSGAAFYDFDGAPIKKSAEAVGFNAKSADKNGYEYFMMKEIYDQPETLRATINQYITPDGKVDPGAGAKGFGNLKDINRIFIVGCGSAYHAGVVGKYVIEELVRIPVEADIASEFRYRDPILDEHTLVIIISQSGETADTLAALRLAKESGARVMSIVNVEGSTIATESDCVLFTRAGIEIAVATTKAYSAQIATLYVAAVYMAQELKTVSEDELRLLVHHLALLPDAVEKALGTKSRAEELAAKYYELDHAYYVGRNIDYASAMESSLKLKEISYVHSEAYAAGELKHGTISLIEDGTLVIALCCCRRLLAKTQSNIEEVRARGARIICVTTEDEVKALKYDDLLTVPATHPLFVGSLEVVPLQLFAYYTAKFRKCDIDKPRCLAKSVTVE